MRALILFALLTLILTGCTPAGPRALLKGKELLDAGDDARAYTELTTATMLLKTNAEAWNYLGVAAQGSGHPVDAANAYMRALELDRDLVEAHFNLGCLYLEQNQLDSAKSELTSYTMRRPNDPEGWRKLGSVQLRLGETVAAERSFSAVIYLKPKEKDADAYNGLGLARVQRGRPREAVQYFAAAIQIQPDFAPAILNLASTEQEYLRDNQGALDNYRKYLALLPRPDNWDEINAIVNNLEHNQPAAPLTMAPPTALTTTSSPPPRLQAVTPPTQVNRPQVSSHSEVSPPPPAMVTRLNSGNVPMQTVRIAPEPTIVTHPVTSSSQTPAARTTTASTPVGTSADPIVAPPLIVGETPPEKSKGSFWNHLKPTKWFGSSEPVKEGDSEYVQHGVTPLTPAPVTSIATRPWTPITRYQYLSPARPVAGERRPASGAFTKAQLYEQDEDWNNAMLWYGQAAAFDPSWFEAHYNEGVVAQRIRNFTRALTSYEYALAIEPDSIDARYNFALSLKAAGHPQDAANELQKITAAHPSETRAYLALGNLYAQSLQEPAKARQAYEKVLELDPRNAQAPSIRSWLNGRP